MRTHTRNQNPFDYYYGFVVEKVKMSINKQQQKYIYFAIVFYHLITRNLLYDTVINE